jgi:hypothetical protein
VSNTVGDLDAHPGPPLMSKTVPTYSLMKHLILFLLFTA